MPFCGEASGWSKFAFIFLLVAMAIHCTGFGTPYWMKSSTSSNSVNITIGLWKMVNCSGNVKIPCTGSSVPSSYETRAMWATRGIECTVLVLFVMVNILAFFYVTSPGARTQRVAAWVMLLAFFNMGLTVTGIVIWTVYLPDKHYTFWSAGLTVVSGSVSMVAGILMIQDIRMFDYHGARIRKIKKKARKIAKKRRKSKY